MGFAKELIQMKMGNVYGLKIEYLEQFCFYVLEIVKDSIHVNNRPPRVRTRNSKQPVDDVFGNDSLN